jgi:two-component system, cell cycle sensor histidine kinase and response regulator CckA
LPHQDLTKLNVILIEDDPNDTRLIQAMLAECDEIKFQVNTCNTIGAGVEHLKKETPDLILLDLSLPDTTGFDGLRRVRAAAPNVDLIMLTSNNDNRVGIGALSHGANDYLVKGKVDANLLVRTILFSRERRKLEEQLRQSQKVDAIGRLAGGIAHDFNNQLGIMSLLLAEIMGKNTSKEIEPAVLNLNTVVNKCGRLVSQILAFSRNQVLQPKPVDVNQLSAEILPLMQRMVGSQIQVTFVPGAANCLIEVDKNQFEQVLWNLVINAKDAIVKQGEINVRTSIEQAANGEYVIIEIADTGCGIPKDILPKIFDPFFTTKGQAAGTGLGLSTVIGIIQQSQATINVTSEVGKGTRFRMRFPICIKVPMARPVSHVGQLIGHKVVLVCDDEELLLDLISDVLEGNDMTVLKANSGAEALTIFKKNPNIDLVITDLTMPHMDGKQLAQELESVKPEVKVIYISGYAHGKVGETGMVKNSSYLGKPFTKESLLAAVTEILHDAK